MYNVVDKITTGPRNSEMDRRKTNASGGPSAPGRRFPLRGLLRRAGRAQLRDVGPRSFPPLRSGLSTPHISQLR